MVSLTLCSGKDGPVRRALHLWYPWLFVSSFDFARCISWRMHQNMNMSFLDAVDVSCNASSECQFMAILSNHLVI